jgi:hypothetical protein
MAKKTKAEIIVAHKAEIQRKFTPKEIAKAVYKAYVSYHGAGDDNENAAIAVTADALMALGLNDSMVVPTVEIVANIPENDV